MDSVKFIKVKNWREHQHYAAGSRNVSWIKLHLRLRQNYDFSSLSDTQKVHLLSLWMLAVEGEGMVPTDQGWLEKHNLSSKRMNLKPLIDAGFVEIAEAEADINAASRSASKDASPIQEQEKEEEKEKENPPTPLTELVGILKDRDEDTLPLFERQFGSLPEAAFRTAGEVLGERRRSKDRGPLVSEKRYVYSVLRGMKTRGDYSRRAVA